MPDDTLAIITATFLLAGLVKGVIGLGLPTVSLGLLTALIGLPEAMALLIVPSFATNVWQAFSGGHGLRILYRIWPFLVAATTTIWVGALAIGRVEVNILSGLLGLLLATYAITGLSGFRLTIRPPREAWAGAAIGATNGILTGMTGSFVVPGVMFLQAIGLSKDMLVQAMGMLFMLSTVGLALALGVNGMLSAESGWLSAFSLLPALLGMAAGRAVRNRLSEERFRQVFLAAILALGFYIVTRSLF